MVKFGAQVLAEPVTQLVTLAPKVADLFPGEQQVGAQTVVGGLLMVRLSGSPVRCWASMPSSIAARMSGWFRANQPDTAASWAIPAKVTRSPRPRTATTVLRVWRRFFAASRRRAWISRLVRSSAFMPVAGG